MTATVVTLDGSCDFIKTSVDVQGSDGLNLGSKTWGISATRVSNVIVPPVPSDFFFSAAVSAGAVTFKGVACKGDGTDPTFGSPDDTITLAFATDAEKKTLVVPTTADADTIGIAVQGVSGGAGATVSFYHAAFVAVLEAGRGTRMAIEGWNCISPDGGNGSYVPS